MIERNQPEAMLHAAMAGDADALSLLWREHRRWVAAVLLAHLPGGIELEDLLQDVAVTFVANLRTLRSAAAFRPWLRAIAINAARSAGRRKVVHQRAMGAMPENVDDWPQDPAHATEQERLRTRDRLRQVLVIVRSMQPDYREPMWLRAVHGLSQQQIADTLALPVTTIETRLARGRRMLRAALAETVGAGVRDQASAGPRPGA